MAAMRRLLLCYLLVACTWIHIADGMTNPQDAAVLRSLKDQWGNTPPSWDRSDDPCADWEGVSCNNSRVASLGLSTMGLTGKVSGDIGGLTELLSLDLSFNPGLTGSLSPRLGDLQKLTILILAGCSFTNSIPSELGNLTELTFLALNSNNLTGEIPPSLGKLCKLYWLDLAENKLSGELPVSSLLGPGLDQLRRAKHLFVSHFNKNQLSGEIPSQLFNSDMALIHVLLDGNQLEGNIPSAIGLVKPLEVLRLDRNSLKGSVPSALNNLNNMNELNLAHNMLSGALPNLTGMNSLNYVDLSNNSFQQSEAPDWLSTLQSLTTLIIEYGSLEGPVPSGIFSLPQVQQVKLRNNALGGKLDMSGKISQQLQLIDLEHNDLSSVTIGSEYKSKLLLTGNPVCSTSLENTAYCQIQQSSKPYSTSLANCGSQTCASDEKLNPQSCGCTYPYEGTLYFRAPYFRDLSNASLFHSLEMSLWVKLGLLPGLVSLQNPFFNVDDYLQVQLELFPSNAKYLNRSEVQRIGFSLTNQTYKPPPEFGPYYFMAVPYIFGDEHERIHVSAGVIAGITTGCALLVVVLAALAAYALRQKKRAEEATSLSNPFASWAPSGKDSGGAPQLKGARWFSYEELKRYTNNFSEGNQIGSGGYGKVYRGMLPSGELVAIKRARQGSTQGALEFKTEIELLSRVHHKNLVGLVGFGFEQGEQMLVYEFIESESALWCWETRDLKLMPKFARAFLKVRRTCRKRIQERIMAVLAMIHAMENLENNENCLQELMKASEKLCKVLNEADIRLLLENMSHKTGSEMAEKEAKRQEKLLIKQMEKSKRQMEKERKKMDRELQKEKLRSEKELKRLHDEAEKEAKRREKEENDTQKLLKKQQEEAEKDQRRKEKEDTELRKRLALQKQASLMERFLKRNKTNSTSQNESLTHKETMSVSTSDIFERTSNSVILAMDSVLARNDGIEVEDLWKSHLNTWHCTGCSGRSNRKVHWGTRQKPKTELIKELKLTTNKELTYDEDLNIEKLVDGWVHSNVDERLSQMNSDNSPLSSGQKRIQVKQLLQFNKSYRPAFYGVWPRKSKVVGPRHPFVKDPDIDYEVDSDEEWEEDEPGESLSDCDKDDEDESMEGHLKDEEEEEESEDGFFVPDGYLSENEGLKADEMECEDLVEEESSLPTSEQEVQSEEFSTLLRQQKYLNSLTEHALKKNQPLIILNLMHEKTTLLPAYELIGTEKLESLCLQTLSIRPVSGFMDREISIHNDVADEDQEATSIKSGTTTIETAAAVLDSNLPGIISIIQSCPHSIGKIVKSLHNKFPAVPKSELRNKVREISEFSDNLWQVKKEIISKHGLNISPEKSYGNVKSIAAFLKRCLPPSGKMATNPSETYPQSSQKPVSAQDYSCEHR